MAGSSDRVILNKPGGVLHWQPFPSVCPLSEHCSRCQRNEGDFSASGRQATKDLTFFPPGC